MPKYHVERSTHIESPPETVFDTVANFGTWTSWSPWLCCEPDANVVVSDDSSSVGSLYQWEGELVGQGEAEHVKLERGKLIEEELRFMKPFSSKAKVTFEFVPENDGTRVTWHMDGALPWFLFWMKSMMSTFIGMDYERGLRMLKEKIETGTVLSKTIIHGVEPIGPLHMVGVRKTCAMSEIGPSMEAAIAVAQKRMVDAGVEPGQCMSAYHKWDMKKQTCEYTTGFAVCAGVAVDGLESWSTPATNALRIEHVGRYQNVGNAWSAGHQYLRYKKLKMAKVASLERYMNSPDDTPVAKLRSEIHLFVR